MTKSDIAGIVMLSLFLAAMLMFGAYREGVIWGWW